MNLGQVFKFTTDQAVGHHQRNKIHIFLTTTDHFRAPQENVFLFISSGDYGNCFPIKKSDYATLLDHDSYISCGNLVFYSDNDLKNVGSTIGQISNDHLKALHSHLVGHQVMPGWQIKIACNALAVML
jgi:hypothetical protein